MIMKSGRMPNALSANLSSGGIVLERGCLTLQIIKPSLSNHLPSYFTSSAQKPLPSYSAAWVVKDRNIQAHIKDGVVTRTAIHAIYWRDTYILLGGLSLRCL